MSVSFVRRKNGRAMSVGRIYSVDGCCRLALFPIDALLATVGWHKVCWRLERRVVGHRDDAHHQGMNAAMPGIDADVETG